MGMYNELFLVYVALLGLSFFTLLNTLLSFDLPRIADDFKRVGTRQAAGIFLMVNSILIGRMRFGWFGIPTAKERITLNFCGLYNRDEYCNKWHPKSLTKLSAAN